jgi:hypothetical protein
MHRNVFVRASFLSRSETAGAIRDGYADRLMRILTPGRR